MPKAKNNTDFIDLTMNNYYNLPIFIYYSGYQTTTAIQFDEDKDDKP